VFPDTLIERELLAEISRLNADDDVDGILVQLPLPKHIEARNVDRPRRSVKGCRRLSSRQRRRLHLGRTTLVPCTPAGVMRLIDSTGTKIEGKHAVVVGRSDIVGKPMAGVAPATQCHRHDRALTHRRPLARSRDGDILVVAVGRPILINGKMIKRGAVVVDVGMNRVDSSFAPRLAHDEEKSVSSQKTARSSSADVDYAMCAKCRRLDHAVRGVAICVQRTSR